MVASKVVSALPALARDLFGLLGTGLLIYGTWQIYPPAADILAGVMLLTAAILLARRGET